MKRFFPTLFPILAIIFFIVATPFAIAVETIDIQKDVPPQPTIIPFENPLNSRNLITLITSIIDQIFPFAITLITLAIIYVGFRMVIATGSGNASELTKWRKFLIYAIIGAAIVVASGTLIEAIRPEQFARRAIKREHRAARSSG